MSTNAVTGVRRYLGVPDGIAIMMGVVIGVGIFRTPPLVAGHVDSSWAFLGVWLAGGAVMLIGALCYAELASRYPDAGGEYHFLSRALGQRVAILFGWARGTVIQTGGIAAVAFVFGDYASTLLPLGEHGPALYAGAAIIVFTLINVAGTHQGRMVQRLFTLLTVALMLGVIVLGLGSMESQTLSHCSSAPMGEGVSALGMAMVFVLITYGGWNEAAYLSADMRSPRHDMASVLVVGSILLIVLYTLINLSYLGVLGLEGLRNSDAVASHMMQVILGDTGATVMTLIVIAATLSTLNATLFTGARVYYALGRDLPPLKRLGMWSQRGDNPSNALVVQGILSMVLVALGDLHRDGFEAMVDYTAPVFWGFLLLIGLSLLVLRQREGASGDRVFRVPLYPLIPVLFCLTCAGLVYSSLLNAGIGGVIGVAIVALGIPLLYWRRREATTAT
ncbi:amino acid/polyamine/organocation transporter, APC superfamily [Kushneria avicenniae]|uniref:Amino acid/polyamine/organocation transporter, APC superfamily n=1 Tax=Kushneria avicenniae TaxID=402385 RepID=A0A1I1M2P1_9GAMM|nr:amino acid permease [Kushneria avicenniae]SFC75930.1 amino acid/polyamine/organocation transporter, APC superfamily [Kushneria avicenniae]